MRTFLLVLFVAFAAMGQPFIVQQGRFDTSSGWQTKQMDDSPFTNYFAVRTASTNFVFVNDNTNLFSPVESFWVTNDWSGNFSSWQVTTNSQMSVLKLDPGSGSIQLQLTNLYPGLYGIQIFGVVTNVTALDAWRLPLLWKIQANDASDGSTNTYHLIQNYVSGRNYDIGQFWVQAIQNSGPSNNIYISASLDGSSLVHCKVVALHFFSPVDWSDTNIYKNIPTLYTTEEQSGRVTFASTNTTDSTIVDWRNGSPALPNIATASNLTNLFNRWMPLNAMFDEVQGAYVTNVNGTVDWNPSPYHSLIQNYGTDYGVQWGWTNIVSNQSYTLANSLAGTAVPGTTNDYVGFYYTNGYWVSTFGSYQGYGLYRAFIMPMMLNINGNSLPYRYYTFPSGTNAHVAGLLLAKFALTYPTYRMEAMDINQQVANPALAYGGDMARWLVSRPGKLEYDGWAGTSQGQIAQAVDYLWPYVSTSTAFATDLTKFVPWIGGSTNNVKLFFDSHILRSLVFDAGYRARGGDPMQLGLVIQSGVTSSNLMNPAESKIEITPATTSSASWKKQYAGTYIRDGGNLIGSLSYMLGENALLTGPDLTARYIAVGGNPGPFNISNPNQWPKLKSFADFYANAQVAYGYSASFGDSSSGINTGPTVLGVLDPFLIELWRFGNNARIGKYIVDVRGRTTQTDAEWSTMQSQSASTALDLRFPLNSRIFGGIGIASLEHGTGSTNQSQRGAVVLRTVSGSGHSHADHLDMNIYALGCRMGTDFAVRNDSGPFMLPASTSTRVHNVVEVDGYNHISSQNEGWPGGNNSDGYSQYTAFSTNGLVQFIGADLWSGTVHTNVTYQHRDVAACYVDPTNFYVVDFQRVDGGRFHSWAFHGADVGGETAGFTTSVTMTNAPLDFTDSTASNPSFFLRKHATNSTYAIQTYGSVPSKLYAEWRLGRTATAAGTLLNADGNGGSTTAVAPEQAMFGANYSAANPRLITRATLFDRTNETVGVAWAFSPNYNIVEPRLYVFNAGTQYYSNLVERSSTWMALYDAYAGSRFVTSESSLSTDSALTNAWQPKAIQVVTASGTDVHYSSATNLDVTAGSDVWNGTYGFARDVSGSMQEMKLVGGTKFIHGSSVLTITTNNLYQTIASVNWTNGTLALSGSWPGARHVGWYRMRNANHETSYYITAWTDATNATYTGDALCGELDMSSVSGNNITFTAADGGMVLANYPKRGTGITGANEARTKVVHLNYATGTTATRVDGDSIATGDFTDADGDGHTSMFLYDFGPGDSVEVPSEVTIHKNSANDYTILANASFTFSGFTNANWQINTGSGYSLITNGVVALNQLTGEQQDVNNGTTTTATAATVHAGTLRSP